MKFQLQTYDEGEMSTEKLSSSFYYEVTFASSD